MKVLNVFFFLKLDFEDVNEGRLEYGRREGGGEGGRGWK